MVLTFTSLAREVLANVLSRRKVCELAVAENCKNETGAQVKRFENAGPDQRSRHVGQAGNTCARTAIQTELRILHGCSKTSS